MQFKDTWISNPSDVQDELSKQVVDHLLGGSSDNESTVAKRDLKFQPTAKSEHVSTTESWTSGKTSESSTLANFVLPNGNAVTVGALLRLLLRAMTHRCELQDGKPYYYFRGYEGIELWSILFFEEHDELKATQFGNLLIDRGLVHNYTPKCEKLAHSFLVLQPLQEPRVLNTFVKWPSPSDERSDRDEDPMDVILRLSRLMDDICSATDYRENLPLFHDLEEAVCQLQTTRFPDSPVEKVTFGINLFNLVVRHGMIVAGERNWTWPQALSEVPPFFSKIGYNVAGEWINLADLQASLYGQPGARAPSIYQPRRPLWKRLQLCNGIYPDTDLHYDAPIVRTDTRILLATTWGTYSSPGVSTLYPNRLEEGLQTAAEAYCQRHVIVCASGQVSLPSLLSWHRHDFGQGTPDHVMMDILPYLSVIQLRQIEDHRNTGSLRAVFDSDFDWKCGIYLSTSDANLTVRQQEMPLSSNECDAEILPEQAQVGAVRKTPQTYAFEPSDSPGNILRPRLANNGRKASSRGLRRLAGRQPSTGEFQMFPPGRNVGKVPDNSWVGSVDGDPCDNDDDGHSFFQSVVSDVTYGSDFYNLLGTRSHRRLNV